MSKEMKPTSGGHVNAALAAAAEAFGGLDDEAQDPLRSLSWDDLRAKLAAMMSRAEAAGDALRTQVAALGDAERLSQWRGSRITVLEAALDKIISLAAEQSADWPGASRAEEIAHAALDRGITMPSISPEEHAADHESECAGGGADR